MLQQLCRSFSNSSVRLLSCRASTCSALVYEKLGQPEDVVKLVSDYPVADVPSADNVTVDMMMCPINPSDINQIQGVYAIRPPLPAVGGGEGVGVVSAVGSRVTSLQPGDWVIPASTSLGTWRTRLVQSAKLFTKIRDEIPLHTAATLSVNPTTAYRMLKDFASLEQGDCIIQNGANSGVGQAVIQLAAAWGIKTINVIRDRPNFDELKSYLVELGATEVVTEEFCSSHKMATLIEGYGKPILGLNTVGGKSAVNVMKQLARSGTMVTYGGMSMKPVTIGTGSLIFKDLRIRGHWNAKWLERNANSEAHLSMVSELCDLAIEGHLQAKQCEEHSLDDYRSALSKAMVPYVGTKQLLNMRT